MFDNMSNMHSLHHNMDTHIKDEQIFEGLI